jgi:hypothetical protein
MINLLRSLIRSFVTDSRGNKSGTKPIVTFGCISSVAALFTGHLTGQETIAFWTMLAVQWQFREYLEKRK